MRRLVLLAAMVAALGIVGPEAATARDKIPTDLTLESVENLFGDQILIAGIVDSPRAKCRSGRTVKAIRGRSTLVDVDTTSENGAWAMVVSFGGANQLTLKVTKSKFGRPGYRHVCEQISAGLSS